MAFRYAFPKRSRFLFFALIVSASALQGQQFVSVEEAKITASLKNDRTTVSIPVANTTAAPVKALLSLNWINNKDKESIPLRREIVIEPGASTIETQFPLESPSIWTRLKYRLVPVNSIPVYGIVSLSHIANHVFELKASTAATTQHGGTLTVYGQAVHPITRKPVSVAAVQWDAALDIADQIIKPAQTRKHAEGFVEFAFNVPTASKTGNDDTAEIGITAALGDFEQSVSLSLQIPNRLSARIQTDKPIYQPGQPLHLRAVILDPQGHAAPGAKVVLKIDDASNERIHTAHLTASKHGIVQDDWQLPTSSSLGNFRISLVAEDDDDYQLASHSVKVSRYELPSFQVTLKPSQAVYLSGETARVTVTGTYLFGKPVPKGHVRIMRDKEPRWNPKTRKQEPVDELVTEGDAKGDGTLTTEIDLESGHADLEAATDRRFEDIRFAAYFTDPTTRRTEQRRFDLRISRDPIHIYVIRGEQAVYVATSFADGRPASADVELQLPKHNTVRLRTNRYGVGKLDIRTEDQDFEDGVILKATDAATGKSATWRERYWPQRLATTLSLDSPRVIHRAGESVTLRLQTQAADSPPDQAVLIYAIAGGKRIAARIAQIKEHRGEVTFPYQPEFRRTVVFVAWNALNPSTDFQSKIMGTRTVLFPDASDLKLSVASGQQTYKPGDAATVNVRVSSASGQPMANAALAIAVVDQAVLERARTDNDFGDSQRPWFACAFCRDDGEAELGGVRLNDLYALKPSQPISPDLDLVAEALLAHSTGGFLASDSSEAIEITPVFPSVEKQIKTFTETLDRHYNGTFEFPRDLDSLSKTLGREWTNAEDPWGRPYRASFGIDHDHWEISVFSAGPDKRYETADDFLAGTIRREYFKPYRNLINQALRAQLEYPAAAEEFAAVLRSQGLDIASLRDPWQTPYRAEATTRGIYRNISITSAGPDKSAGTRDDFTVAMFAGLYFRRETNEILKALKAAPREPQNNGEFVSVLSRAGIDIAQYRDAWGRTYRLANLTSSRYADRVRSSTRRVFGEPQPATTKTEVTPVTQTILTFVLRSDGPDGIEGSYDDFAIAAFPVVLREESKLPPTQASATTATRLPGTGAISGTVTDASGATVPNVTVRLLDATGNSYESRTDAQGVYFFTSVPVGTYSLRAETSGFMAYELSRIPVKAGQTTTADVELRVASVSETVTVEAASMELNTMTSASVATNQAISTPRVREYFPETLLWLPEVITSRDGTAQARFKTADSVTTWKIAAFASTLDGRFAETEADLRVFQPFFIDFNPPQVLTQGDEIEIPATIRNYLPKAQSVTVTLQNNDWSTPVGKGTRDKRVSVPPNGSQNVDFTIQTSAQRPVVERGLLRISAQASGTAGKVQDAIEKSTRVHPDGQETSRTFGDFLSAGAQASFNVPIPAAAIAGATRAELRIYPNIASLLLESASAILIAPHGCAEQTVSAGYANLIALRFARASGMSNPQIEQRVLSNVRQAVDALAGFRHYEGGMRYWPNDAADPDIAVTAHTLSFLVDAQEAVPVDPEQLRVLASWLEKTQQKDGRWLPRYRDSKLADRQSLLLTAAVVRALASSRVPLSKDGGSLARKTALTAAFHHLEQFTAQTDEPYMLANFLLAALDAGIAREPIAQDTMLSRLIGMAREERGGLYWDLQTNSPFYGWGTAGRYESTGLVVSALAAWRRAGKPSTPGLEDAIRRGVVFLIRGRGASGDWYSTQATLRAMSAIADASPAAVAPVAGSGLDIRSGGFVKSVDLPRDSKAVDPIILDISAALAAGGENQLNLTSAGAGALVRLTVSHWLPWTQTKPRTSPEFRFQVDFDRLDAPPGEPVRCTVNAERVGFRGYGQDLAQERGMLLAEIGLPPGAEVDRASLESALDDADAALDRYEILPDRVILYLWPKAGGSKLHFFLSARNRMSAKSGPSVLYDYYNPEALSELVPSRWTVK